MKPAPFKCPHCKKELTSISYSRIVVQIGELMLENLWFDKGTVDDEEVQNEEAQCPKCDEPIDLDLIPGF